ncbi:amino acid/amide ABC transporter substrate-binding protein, HAAT family (TC 3.A.1.4.-) [Enhydrobacter aerosaccus]|uniref:Amino acid/amide ABC transporter substrate-binding protein, HAAT family (TC 3.A.1.4.-) n=1 Tax=Enhydrobacter aerosaccus TaxID=225324 RepID=A0A1T4TG72_9HYPH|nr:substrate-binding domain-containing protein [Enhydrobacter aerosaccus]SKA39291.1 amino acid/amide ABC transporter substrate-binding protein, HAAT family (TC 3.A.1.4.-) [Enhydrobacter aerosaccus]
MIRIGLLTPLEGPAGIWGPSAEASAIMAIAEINATGGLLGREVDLVIANAGRTGADAAEAAAVAVDIDGIDAIVAMVPSYARKPVLRVVSGRVPYVYTPQFEGDEHDAGVLTVGETSDELLKPGIEWLGTAKGASRYYLVGNDYVWPRATFAKAKRMIRDAGGTVVGERILPFGFEDYDLLFADIRRAQADVVMPYLLGYEAIGFNRAFAETGLARHCLRFTSGIDETILYAIGPDATENFYATSAYFSTLRSRNNDAFLERYHDSFGETPPPINAFGQSCYEGIHCLASLVSAAGAFQQPALRKRVGRIAQSRTARGTEPIAAAGISRPIHFATVEGCEFRIMSPT